MHLERLASCAELTTVHLDEAASSSSAMRELLTWAVRVARPGGGAPKLLLALARLADAPWLEGTPYVEITGDAATTSISVFTSHGMGIRERVFPLVRLAVPVEEFSRAARLAPEIVRPLRMTPRPNGMFLAPAELNEEPSPETIAIDERSLHEQERKTAPPPPAIHTAPTVRRMVAVNPDALRKDED